jgi:hypothetical protein
MDAMDNVLGNFINLEEDFENKIDRKVIKILVGINLCEGLPKEIDMEWGGRSYVQGMEY